VPGRRARNQGMKRKSVRFPSHTRLPSRVRLIIPPSQRWTGGRAVEGARLESVYTSKGYRGFESHLVRHYLFPSESHTVPSSLQLQDPGRTDFPIASLLCFTSAPLRAGNGGAGLALRVRENCAARAGRIEASCRLQRPACAARVAQLIRQHHERAGAVRQPHAHLRLAHAPKDRVEANYNCAFRLARGAGRSRPR
jgi:hypothetical protein